MGSKDLSSLGEVFGCRRQASLSDSSQVATSRKNSALATTMGGGIFFRGGCGNRGDHGRGGHEQGKRGRGIGCGPCKCSYCHGENHTVEFCWALHGKPSAHQVSLYEEENISQLLTPTSIAHIVSILEKSIVA